MELAAVFVLVGCKLDLGNFETWTFHTSKPQNDSCLSNMLSNFWAESRAITENKCRLCETQRGSQRVLHWLYIGCDVRPRTNKKQQCSPTMFGPIGFLRARSPSFVTIPLIFYWSGHSGAKNRVAKTAKTKFELAVGNTNFEETQHSKADIQFAPSWTRHYYGTADLDSLHRVDPIYSVFDVPISTATATTDWDLQPAIFIGQRRHSKVRRFKTVRSARCNAAFNFLLWRLSRYISEPFHTRDQQQMCLALCFYDTSPPTNMPMRISCPDDTFQLQIREWLLGFTHFRRHLFPPLHKPKAPFVHVKRRTWGQSLFNFQKWLQWWHSDDILPCACKQFPDHIQNHSRDLPHIAAWASECYPYIPQLRLHKETAQPSTWTFFCTRQQRNLKNGYINASIGNIFFSNNGTRTCYAKLDSWMLIRYGHN